MKRIEVAGMNTRDDRDTDHHHAFNVSEYLIFVGFLYTIISRNFYHKFSSYFYL